MLKILVSLLFFLFSIPVYSMDYTEVDARAKNVPSQYENNLDSLVRYLILPYKQNDVLKVRALYSWIVYHVEYDMFKYDVISEKKSFHNRNKALRTGDAFKTRVGVCADIADLFSRMAKLANIKEEQISGYAGSNLTMDNFKDFAHAWNAVYINKKWLFVDATWGMGGDYKTFENVRSVAEHKKEIRRKKYQKNRVVDPNRFVDDKWFLVEPEEFIKTHFPKREKQQYLKRPVNMKKVFRENSRKSERKR
ncbi:MAG: hypothetical protein IJY92_02450 [Alphaproteobacteria bacterium]|nr:hypothetical protein [Alphaproteobacteria bacterium]